jgi:thiamine-monophosphate kinase
MTSAEFELIGKYFNNSDRAELLDEDIVLDNGDDCAIVSVPSISQLAITVDTLISGVHFPVDTAPEDIAFKALMVNLSDLSSMGARPRWITLAISLPEIDHDWLSAFSGQLNLLLQEWGVRLIGGDTTRGHLSITIQAMGLVEKDRFMRRDVAAPGDSVFVTGTIGDAAIGLKTLERRLEDTQLSACVARLNRPLPNIRFAEELSAISRCAIDISDGLLADLGHILEASNCGATIELDMLPVSDAARYYFETYNKGQTDWSLLLAGGDDYELCFTVSPNDETRLLALAARHGVMLSRIGNITKQKGARCIDINGDEVIIDDAGFDHFVRSSCQQAR